MTKECVDCRFYKKYATSFNVNCKIHPFYDRNKNGDCDDFRLNFYKFYKAFNYFGGKNKS